MPDLVGYAPNGYSGTGCATSQGISPTFILAGQEIQPSTKCWPGSEKPKEMTLVMVDKPLAERRKAFGAALGEALQVRGLTQAQLGQQLGGITQSAISQWRSGDVDPGPETVFKVEKALDLPPGHLSRHLGYLPPSAENKTSLTTEDMLINDPLLDDIQKRGMLAMYREFTGRRRRRKHPEKG
jgi:transcriptional regulator with XRE-family HTH domain